MPTKTISKTNKTTKSERQRVKAQKGNRRFRETYSNHESRNALSQAVSSVRRWLRRSVLQQSGSHNNIVTIRKVSENEILKKISILNDILILGYESALLNNPLNKKLLTEFRGVPHEKLEKEIEELKEELYRL